MVNLSKRIHSHNKDKTMNNETNQNLAVQYGYITAHELVDYRAMLFLADLERTDRKQRLSDLDNKFINQITAKIEKFTRWYYQ